MTEQIPQAAPPTGSTFARIALLVYTLLIVYASWYPFSGWHDLGLSPLAYPLAPLPHYWTRFDLATNIIAYIPFGILMVFAVYPRLLRVWAVLFALASGIVLAGTMEAVQTYLPSRVASNLDLFTNVAGTLIGALIGIRSTRAFLEQSRLLMLRERWFSSEASRGLIVVALWPLAQIYPQAYLFGHGQVTPVLSGAISGWLAIPIDLSALWLQGTELAVRHYWLSETLISTCGLCGAVLSLLCLLRPGAPALALSFLLVAAAITVKSMTSALMFTPEHAFSWLTPGAQGGLLLGVVMLSGLVFAPAAAQRRVAILTLAISLVVVNIVPANPYFAATLDTWVQGKFLNFNGTTQFLSLLWPFFALWFLARPMTAREPAKR